jgi:hypothetical protein
MPDLSPKVSPAEDDPSSGLSSDFLRPFRLRMEQAVWRVRHELWLLARTDPRVFYALAPHRGFRDHELVGPDTELVIEGYPRSANSYAVIGFHLAQSQQRKLAHHTHAPAQVIRAVKQGTPVIVPIRHPRDAVSSLLIRDSRYTIDLALRAYGCFYKAIMPCADHGVLATFEDITRDLGGVVHAVNRRFGTDFDLPSSDPEQVSACFRVIEAVENSKGGDERSVARPSSWREARKGDLVTRIQQSSIYEGVLDLYEQTVAARSTGSAPA